MQQWFQSQTIKRTTKHWVQENTRYAVQQYAYIHGEEGVEKPLYTITITIAQPLNTASSSLHVTVTQNPTPENTIHTSGLSERKLSDSHGTIQWTCTGKKLKIKGRYLSGFWESVLSFKLCTVLSSPQNCMVLFCIDIYGLILWKIKGQWHPSSCHLQHLGMMNLEKPQW